MLRGFFQQLRLYGRMRIVSKKDVRKVPSVLYGLFILFVHAAPASIHPQAGSNIGVQSLTAPAAVPGVDFSDHLNYWKYKFPAVMITNTAFFRNPHYHLPSDKIETLNFDKMAEVVRGVYWTVVHLD
jgi:hypothetical protein